MRKQYTLPLLVGCLTTIIAGASYALIDPNDAESKSTQVEKVSTEKVEREVITFLPPDTQYEEPMPEKPFKQNPSSLREQTSLKETAILPIERTALPSSLKEKQHATNDESGKWLTHTITSGENLSLIFKKLGQSSRTLHEIVTSDKKAADELAKIQPGGKIKILLSDQGELKKLVYGRNKIESLVVTKTDSGFKTAEESKPLTAKVVQRHGVINSSLFIDAKKAGLSDKLIMEMANIFGWDVDFALDLRAGDEFTVLYEKLYLDGKEVSTGKILAAEFINQGNPHQAILYKNAKGDEDYFSPQGKSLKRAFLRTPVSYTRISSRFNLGRKHPILNKIRAHKGVDYAAATGTPVRATGNGKIVYRARKGGYGRVVVIQHGQKYSTLYAHLSNYNSKAKNGDRVTQGQIIGYVGQSGLATGPHLHYEFRLNGVHRNPLTVELPQAEPLDNTSLASFQLHAQPLMAKLEAARQATVMAAAATK